MSQQNFGSGKQHGSSILITILTFAIVFLLFFGLYLWLGKWLFIGIGAIGALILLVFLLKKWLYPKEKKAEAVVSNTPATSGTPAAKTPVATAAKKSKFKQDPVGIIMKLIFWLCIIVGFLIWNPLNIAWIHNMKANAGYSFNKSINMGEKVTMKRGEERTFIIPASGNLSYHGENFEIKVFQPSDPRRWYLVRDGITVDKGPEGIQAKSVAVVQALTDVEMVIVSDLK